MAKKSKSSKRSGKGGKPPAPSRSKATTAKKAKTSTKKTPTRKKSTTRKAAAVKSVVAAAPAVKSPRVKTRKAASAVPPISQSLLAKLSARRSEPARPSLELREPLTDAQLRKIDSGLTRKDLEHYQNLLMQKRHELLGDVESLVVDARADSGDRLSPEHMADVGSNNYEQEFTLGLVESERRILREIDEALVRIKSRTYGICMETGVPIGKARLDAKPWAKYCVDVAREKERRGAL